jgi:Asp-tRNA(Asn)/Glu-tRNA(Gln) amidotransferase C subunit
MLSYLKDGSQNPLLSEMSDAQAQGSEPAAGQVADYLTVSGQGKKVRQSTMILAVVFAVGALGVWLMIKKTTPAAADAAPSQDQSQLEAALAQLDTMQTEMNTQMNSVVGRFYQFSNIDQVGVNELKKNPFYRELDFRMDSETPESDAFRAQQQLHLHEEAQRLQMGLELWSITATPKGMCCMVNDKVLYVGDSFREMTVSSIEGKTVILDYKGIPVELKMDE